MNKSGIIILLFFSLGFTIQTKELRQKHFNLTKSVAIDGYDAVAYFTQKKAIKGKKEFSISAEGILYYFSTDANKELFKKNYSAYEPQFGGWCAYAMGNSNEKVEVDPKSFKITKGKLYLFYNAYFNNTLTDWNKDETNLLAKANKNWSAIFK